MNLKDVYIKCDEYDFSRFDICSKDELISMLICHIKNITKSKYYFLKNELELTDVEAKRLFECLDKIIYEKTPVQYVIGEVAFYNEKYTVNNNVLIPRQDTETLVEKAIEYINKYNLKDGLDLCCGSGAIGVSVCKNSNISTMHFVDVSKEALDTTRKNIEINEVKQDISAIHSNLFENLMTSKSKYDIIMSNPPYIPTEDIPNLSDYVKNEPVLALDGGKTGLVFYEKIINEARRFLNDNGYILFEIGYNQMNDLTKLFNEYTEYEIVEKVKDLNSNDRVIICRFHKI